jgi:hypothetical protein
LLGSGGQTRQLRRRQLEAAPPRGLGGKHLPNFLEGRERGCPSWSDLRPRRAEPRLEPLRLAGFLLRLPGLRLEPLGLLCLLGGHGRHRRRRLAGRRWPRLPTADGGGLLLHLPCLGMQTLQLLRLDAEQVQRLALCLANGGLEGLQPLTHLLHAAQHTLNALGIGTDINGNLFNHGALLQEFV